ncbi:Erg28 protein [Schizosaccharomyces cryophilus OY26]|uniref:Erg28 protein n=1 Tax=Schizosaccharomyces cryophilus (strain OY26 / ATCC MYA-4695 / CBS 11777 / NBRC 106824 / NRRL Y48691) TaxID=653667 RepID=S9VTF4_SCHCR|nr:Erg28 protein [Schizosaccharomyces cryophilus OY26]EPY49419.1 Erg28 protein [Schizosaccharomyces cryophilus OY26]
MVSSTLVYDVLSNLPEGTLAKWNLLVGFTAIFNTIQSYITPKLTKRVYSNSNEVNGLQGRTFGLWTFLSALIRIYCAYHMSSPDIYFICQCTYYLASFHFLSEWLLFRSANMGVGLLSPIIVSTISITWMAKEKQTYLGLTA